MFRNSRILLGTAFFAVALTACNVAVSNKASATNSETRNEDVESSGKSNIKTSTLLDTKVQGNAKNVSSALIPLKREAYRSAYDPKMKLPVWVAWNLTAKHTDGPYKREGIKFAPDMDVPAPRAENMDYVNSGYDRGHMCPSGDNRWSETAQTQSFLYTNCCPQLHSLNNGDWKELEEKCRTWAKRYGSIYIVCGPLMLNKKHKTIGKNKVVVPEAFYKVVLRLGKNPSAIGFVYRNEKGKKNKMSTYVNSVDEVERLTGLDFFSSLPDNIENKVEAKANLSEWE